MLKAFVSIQNRLAMLRDEKGQTMAEYGVVLRHHAARRRCSHRPVGQDQRRLELRFGQALTTEGTRMMLRKGISLIDESAQTMAEYAFVLSVIILGVIVSLTFLSEGVAAGIDNAVDLVDSLF
jgi:Flp pilus assembly pilin Flp